MISTAKKVSKIIVVTIVMIATMIGNTIEFSDATVSGRNSSSNSIVCEVEP